MYSFYVQCKKDKNCFVDIVWLLLAFVCSVIAVVFAFNFCFMLFFNRTRRQAIVHLQRKASIIVKNIQKIQVSIKEQANFFND